MDNHLKMASTQRTRLIVAIAIFALAFAYPLYKFFAVQALFPEYQAFPLVIGAILAILYFRLKESEPITDSISPQKRTYALYAVVAGSLVLCLLLLVALQIRSYRFAAIIFSAFLALLVVVSKMHYRIPGVWYIWALTLLPLIRLNRTVVSNLQLWSSWLSSQILEMLGVLHVMRGNTLVLPDRELFVDEACSGIVSLITIISAVSLYCVWMRRSLAHTCLMILLGGMWTVFMNTVRIVAIALALQWRGIDLSEGLPHTLLGVVLFLISLAVLKLVDLILFEFFRPIDLSVATGGDRKTAGYYLMIFWDRWFVNEGAELWQRGELLYGAYGDYHSISSKGRRHRSASENATIFVGFSRNRTLSEAQEGFIKDTLFLLNRPVLLVFLVSLGFQMYLIRFQHDSEAQMAKTRSRANQFTQASQLINPSEYQLVKFEAHTNDKRKDWWGEESRIWIYKTPTGGQFIFSLDFPFGPEFHELSGCYRGAGWDVTKYKVCYSKNATDPWVVSSFNITNEATTQTVFFTSFTPDGKPVQRTDFLSRFGVSRGFLDVGTHYQVQILTNDTASQVSREKGEALLVEAAKLLRDKICSPGSSPKDLSRN